MQYKMQSAKVRKDRCSLFLDSRITADKPDRGLFKVKRCTSIKKFRAKLREYTEWIRKARAKMNTGELMRRAKVRIQGHLNYYAITDTSRMCSMYHHWFTRITFKWLNRRSQRRSYNWDAFRQMLTDVKWPKPRIRRNLSPFQA